MHCKACDAFLADTQSPTETLCRLCLLMARAALSDVELVDDDTQEEDTWYLKEEGTW